MQSLFSDFVPARTKTAPVRPAAAPIDAAPLLIAPGMVVSRYRARLALSELYPAHHSARTLSRAAELLELPVGHPAVLATLNAAHDLNRVLRFRGFVPHADLEAMVKTVAAVR